MLDMGDAVVVDQGEVTLANESSTGFEQQKKILLEKALKAEGVSKKTIVLLESSKISNEKSTLTVLDGKPFPESGEMDNRFRLEDFPRIATVLDAKIISNATLDEDGRIKDKPESGYSYTDLVMEVPSLSDLRVSVGVCGNSEFGPIYGQLPKESNPQELNQYTRNNYQEAIRPDAKVYRFKVVEVKK